jgi:hypothetical protein
VKIADFGIVKLLIRKTQDYTLTGPWQVVGTLNYMAPEQIENPLGLDQRADIYSLGVVLYELLTGKLPRGRYPLPSEKVGVGAEVDSVVLRALEAAPERRYQTAGEMRAAVQALNQPAGAITVEKGAAAPLSVAENTAPVTLRSAAVVTADPIRRRLKWPAIGMLVTGILGMVPAILLLVVFGTLAENPSLHFGPGVAGALSLAGAGLLLLLANAVVIWGAVEIIGQG